MNQEQSDVRNLRHEPLQEEDPFDKDDFNVIEYLNKLFPDGRVPHTGNAVLPTETILISDHPFASFAEDSLVELDPLIDSVKVKVIKKCIKYLRVCCEVCMHM